MSIVLGRKHVVVLAVLGAAALAYFLGDWLIETPEEGIRRIIDDACAAFSRADAVAVVANVDPDFGQEEYDRQELRRAAEEFFRYAGPTRVSVVRCRIRVEGHVGVADLEVNASPVRRTAWGDGGASEWRLSFVRRHGTWYIDRISPLSVGPDPVTSLRSVVGRIPRGLSDF